MSKKKYKNKNRQKMNTGGNPVLQIGENTYQDQYKVSDLTDPYSKNRFTTSAMAQVEGAGAGAAVGGSTFGPAGGIIGAAAGQVVGAIGANLTMDADLNKAKSDIATKQGHTKNTGTIMAAANKLENASINVNTGELAYANDDYNGISFERAQNTSPYKEASQSEKMLMGMLGGGATELGQVITGDKSFTTVLDELHRNTVFGPNPGTPMGEEFNKLIGLKEGGSPQGVSGVKPALNINNTQGSGGVVSGTGGPKDDKINAEIDSKGFVVPAENADLAMQYRREYLGKPNKKAALHSGDTKVKLSDGEHYFSQEEVAILKQKGVDLHALAPNAESSIQNGAKLAEGGGEKDQVIEFEGKKYELSKLKKLSHVGWIYNDGSENGKRLGRFGKLPEYLTRELEIGDDKKVVGFKEEPEFERPLTAGDTQFERNINKATADHLGNTTSTATSDSPSLVLPKSNVDKLYDDADVGIFADPVIKSEKKRASDPVGWYKSLFPEGRPSVSGQEAPSGVSPIIQAMMYQNSLDVAERERLETESAVQGIKDAKNFKRLDTNDDPALSLYKGLKEHHEGLVGDVNPDERPALIERPNLEKEKKGFNADFSGNEIGAALGIAQTAIGLAGITSQGDRPDVNPDLDIQNRQLEAMQDEQIGFTAQQKQFLNKGIEGRRISGINNAVQKYGAQNKNAALALTNLENIKAADAQLKMKIADNDIKLQKKNRTDRLITIASADRRYAENNKLEQFDRSSASFEALLNTGLSNITDTIQYNNFRKDLMELKTS